MKNDNKLIAEFMGWKPNEHHRCLNGDKDLQYDTSWDWLMPVVAKCTELNDDEFDNQSIAWALLSDSIIDAYDHVVEFIKTYNKE
tara:strand:- start:958 stop:1212 length:255 start_codon:yes stop_codon:yes gene_type:complete